MKEYQFKKEEFTCLEELQVPLAVYQFLDRRVCVKVLSRGILDLFGFESREEAYDVFANDLYSTAHPDDASRVADAAYRFATEEDEIFEVIYRLRIGNSFAYRIVHAIGKHVYLETGERLAYVWYTDEGSYTGETRKEKADYRDSFRKALQEESMLQKSHYDYLTGLPNMSYFLELVAAGREPMRNSGQTPAVLFIDLSGMQFFNRKYGFAEGNKLLREISAILVRHFNSKNCSRFGQDHFAVFTVAEGLEEELEEILAECADANEGRSLPVRIGIFLEQEGDVNASTSCDRAKYACDSLQNPYASGFVYFDADMLAEVEHRQYIIEHLDQAIEEQWIQVWYQPIVRAASGKVSDEEALSRWVDPQRGVLPPEQFIPILEEAGLIYKLDLYVVDQVLEKIRIFAAEGLHAVPVSVNLSREDFDSCDIVEEIRRRADEAGIGRDMLNIEITESTVGSDFEFMKEQVERFRELGFHVWMDDFGSGYSSLDLLQNIHFDLIKFDMHFMKRLREGEDGRIILTELVCMAIGLGIDTVCEGVESGEHVEFLQEIGCTKLQGFYFGKAISEEEIRKRCEAGMQIGMENPEESDYYAAIGRINLYDAAAIASDERESVRSYFDTIPTAIYESDGKEFMVTRGNSAYRAFMEKVFGMSLFNQKAAYADMPGVEGAGFLRAIRQCGLDGKRVIVEEQIPDGSTVHALIKRITVNPVTGMAAMVVAVFAVIDKQSKKDSLNYVQIAKALSADYFDLYYVDLNTEDFDQYSSSDQIGNLTAQRHGTDFFEASREDARRCLCEEDKERFIQSFTKENVIHAMDTQGAYSTTYRMLIKGESAYFSMKAVRMSPGDHHIVIGVNNVTEQMQEKQLLEQIRQERTTYARIAALSENYICIYSVNPETDYYREYSATREYKELGLAKAGRAFFETAHQYGRIVVFPEDLQRYLDRFTKAQIMEEIGRNGIFELQYRMMMNGKPIYVSTKAAIVEEQEGPQLIVGTSDIDARIRREQEYERSLALARSSRTGIDTATGVKNLDAFQQAEKRLDDEIAHPPQDEFSIVLFDVLGLEEVRAARGDQAVLEPVKKSCYLVCNLFKHSPVFRLSENRFAVIAQGQDYKNVDAQLSQIPACNEKSAAESGVTLVYGAAIHEGKETVEAVFDRAQKRLENELDAIRR